MLFVLFYSKNRIKIFGRVLLHTICQKGITLVLSRIETETDYIDLSSCLLVDIHLK